MGMKASVGKWLVAGSLAGLLVTGTANAMPLSQTHTITASGIGSVGYTYFTVTIAGTFDLYTKGPTIDPVLYLFNDDGTLDEADFIATDDDSCSTTLYPLQCEHAGSGLNSLIDEIFLATGDYLLAVSDYPFSLSAAVIGSNSNNMIGDVELIIAKGTTGDDLYVQEAVLRDDGSIPEPGTLALFGLGLAGIGAMRRKKLAA